jgi:mannosyltransferase OCH1-like enzyme
MKIRLYLLYFILIIFVWQFVLIIKTIGDLFIGIRKSSSSSSSSSNLQLNEINSLIPRQIHQMWKTSNLLTYPINNSHSQWKQFYPNYSIRLWTDIDVEKLILKNEYIYLYEIYKSYSYSIQRADLARLIILHSEGGIYVDLDVFPSSLNLEYLRLLNVSLIIPQSSLNSCLINHFLISEKHSYILDYILHQINLIPFYKQIYILPYLQVFSTGSIFLTNVIRKRQNDFEDKRLLILSSEETSRYINHDAGRSWHLFDGYLINQIDAKPKRFLFTLLFFSFLIAIFIKYKKFLFILIKLR